VFEISSRSRTPAKRRRNQRQNALSREKESGVGGRGAGKRSKRRKQGFRKTQRGFEYPKGLSLRKKERDEVPRVPQFRVEFPKFPSTPRAGTLFYYFSQIFFSPQDPPKSAH